LGPIGERLCHRDDVGQYSKGIGRERLAGPAKAADHLIEYQQDPESVAVSAASDPELQKNTWLRSLGVSAATALAISKAPGWLRMKDGVKSRLSSCSPTALAISGRQCPAAAVNSPEQPSRILAPFWL
jgi:hypothetical protein